MKWQTRETVKRAAAKGPKAALRASIVHWRQLCKATPGEMKDASFNEDDCALCKRHFKDSCKGCPLKEPGLCCVFDKTPFRRAYMAGRCVYSNTLTSSPEWKLWQRAARKMLKTLVNLL